MSARDRRRVLSREERVLWRTVTQSIAPMRDIPSATSEIEEAAEGVPPPTKPRRTAKYVPVPPKAPPAPAPPPLAPLGRRMRQRVARGRDTIDARFDLHGLTQSEAHAALLHFLRNASARGHKMVLVITGKSGVLRRQVPQWLALPEFRTFVVGFEDAHIAHGGEGALYVRLRRLQSR